MVKNLNTVKIRRRRASYHHGDLRRSLIAAAVTALEEEGFEGLSLRGIAKRAGVTQTAPYAHFEDKRALLAAVAAHGYARLCQHMIDEAGASRSARERFLATGRGYVAFAIEAPALFRLMFSDTLGPLDAVAELKEQADAAYGVFVEALDAVIDKRKFGKSGGTMLRVSAWSMIHGLATLLVEQRLPIEPGSEAVLTRAVTDFYLRAVID